MSLGATFDHVIVGGGTAGCVLAARLSSSRDLNVLLIEAGVDFPPGQEPETIRDPFPSSYADPQFSWPELIAEVGADLGDGRARFSRPFVQGRGIGGSSSIMGMMATRGAPADYESWRDLGATGWGWEDVLPFFRRCEHDRDFAGPLHGDAGPISIRRNPRASWPPFCQAFAQAVEARGHPFVPDYNGTFEDGLSAVPMNSLPDRRVSTATAYLDTAARRRPNLHILANATVERLTCRGSRVTGVTVRTLSGRQNIAAREIVLCAGALQTPAILMRSGIGPGAVLYGLGVSVVADVPGVGRNLQNHPFIAFAVDLPAHARQPAALRTWSFAVLRYSSGHCGCPPGDMQIHPMNMTAQHALGRRIGLLGVSVYKAYSRGELTLCSAEPSVPPRVKMNLLADPRDTDRLIEGSQVALSILQGLQAAGVCNEIFLPPGLHAYRLNRPSLANRLKSMALAQLFAVAAMRRALLKEFLLDPAALVRDRQSLDRLVRRGAGPVHHVCGTCKIGPSSDPEAVLDADLRVRGVEGLRVADASIMPTIVSGNTHMPVVMIAEKAADLILRDVACAARPAVRSPELTQAH